MEGVHIFGDVPPEFMTTIKQAAAGVAAARARAPAEARKASAPCHGCGRVMPAAERCAACVESGVWYCGACHVKFDGVAADMGISTGMPN